MLKKFKDMGNVLKNAKNMKGMMEEVQKELASTVIPIKELGGKVAIDITGELVISKFDIDPSLLVADKKKELETAIKNGLNKGIKQAKDLATTKLQSVTGGLFGEQSWMTRRHLTPLNFHSMN